jgi:dihydrofolate synthase/folylpolyglutamate synthase
VLEVGRGGRFDEVSLIENHVSCFTPIMEEHLDKLGPDIASVAKHKSGIIKDGNIVISAQQPDVVQFILEKEAKAHHSTIYRIKEDITHVSGFQWDIQDVHIELKYLEQERAFRLNTPASYQATNLALAFASAVALEPDAKQVDAFITQRARLPGRCSIIRKHPKVILDGAINHESAYAFLHSVLPLIQYPAVLITALPTDKAYQGVLNELMNHMDMTIITQAYPGHLKYTDDVFDYAATLSDSVINEPDVTEAFHKGLDYVGENGMLWVVGTQSLVREAIRFWNINMDWLVIPSYD